MWRLISEWDGEPRFKRAASWMHSELRLENKEERCLKTKEADGGCRTCVGVSDRGPIRAGDDTNTPQLFWDQDQEALRVSVISSRAGCRRGLLTVGRLMEAKQELLSWEIGGRHGC